MYALTPQGQLKWSFATGDDAYSSPAVGADGTVYVGSDDGKLYALKDQREDQRQDRKHQRKDQRKAETKSDSPDSMMCPG